MSSPRRATSVVSRNCVLPDLKSFKILSRTVPSRKWTNEDPRIWLTQLAVEKVDAEVLLLLRILVLDAALFLPTRGSARPVLR